MMSKLDAILLAIAVLGFGLTMLSIGMMRMSKDIRELKEKMNDNAKEKP